MRATSPSRAGPDGMPWDYRDRLPKARRILVRVAIGVLILFFLWVVLSVIVYLMAL